MVVVSKRNFLGSSRRHATLELAQWADVGEEVGLNAHKPDGEIWRVTKLDSNPFEIPQTPERHGVTVGMMAEGEFVRYVDPSFVGPNTLP